MKHLILGIFSIFIILPHADAVVSQYAKLAECKSRVRNSPLEYRNTVRRTCLKYVQEFSDFKTLVWPALEKGQCTLNDSEHEERSFVKRHICYQYYSNLESFILEHYQKYLIPSTDIYKILEVSCLTKRYESRMAIIRDAIVAVKNPFDFKHLTRTPPNVGFHCQIGIKGFMDSDSNAVSTDLSSLYFRHKDNMKLFLNENPRPTTIDGAIVIISRNLSDFHTNYRFLSESFLDLINISQEHMKLHSYPNLSKTLESRKSQLVSEIAAYAPIIQEMHDLWKTSKPISKYMVPTNNAISYVANRSENEGSFRVLAQLRMLRSSLRAINIYLYEDWDRILNTVVNKTSRAIRKVQASRTEILAVKDFKIVLKRLKEKHPSMNNQSLEDEIQRLDERFSTNKSREKELSILTDSLLINIINIKVMLGL